MREILFRGKRIDNGEWVYGFLYETEKSSSYNAESYILEKERLTINYKCVEGITTHIPFVQVTPDTVGQYTGLTDKNGKKIFEGDILKIYPDYDFPDDFDVSKVYSFNGVLCVDYYTPEYDSTALGFLCELDDVAYEVIGNIHDNPELVEPHGD